MKRITPMLCGAVLAAILLTAGCLPGAGPGGPAATIENTLQFAPPTAQARALPMDKGLAPLTLQFYGEGSDSDGGSVRFDWDFGDGSSAADIQSPSHTYTTPGAYAVQLKVTDDEGNKSTASITVEVLAVPGASAAPTAQAWVGTLFGGAPLVVELRGRGTDPDGGAVTYDWDVDGDGLYEITGQPNAIVTLGPGAHHPRLRVTDDDGATAVSTLTLYVCDHVFPELGPAAHIEVGTLAPAAGAAVQFDGVGGDVDGGAVSFAWDFQGDGVVDSLERHPSFAYGTPGRYTVVLAVTDDEGHRSETTATINVGDTPGPAAEVTTEGLTGTTTFPVQFHARTDVAGATYAWDFDGDGVTDAASSPEHPIHHYTAAGLYPVTLTVTDGAGATATSMLWVAVGHCSEILSPGPGDPSPPPPHNDLHFTEVANNVPKCGCKVTASLPSDFPAPLGFATPVYFVMHGSGFVPATAPSLCEDAAGNPVGTPAAVTHHPALGGGLGLPTPGDLKDDITLPVHTTAQGPLSFIEVFSIKYKIKGSATYNVDFTWNGVPVFTLFSITSDVIKYQRCYVAVGHTGEQHMRW